MLGIPLDQLITLTIGLLIAGAITGVLAGLFGIGGGAVIVPVLYELFSVMGVPEAVKMPLCVGTSLAIIIPTAIRSFQTHKLKGTVDMEVLRTWAIPIVLGVILGSYVATFAPAYIFKGVFIFIATFTAIKMLTGFNWVVRDDVPKGLWMKAYGVILGLLSSLMGIGGGQISNVFLTACGKNIHQAISTSAGVGVLVSIPGAIGFMIAGWSKMPVLPPLSIGFVSLIGAALFIPTSMWTAPMGANLAHRLSKRKLEIAFGCFMLFVSLRFLWNLFA
jgi:uncharacterized protein